MQVFLHMWPEILEMSGFIRSFIQLLSNCGVVKPSSYVYCRPIAGNCNIFETAWVFQAHQSLEWELLQTGHQCAKQEIGLPMPLSSARLTARMNSHWPSSLDALLQSAVHTFTGSVSLGVHNKQTKLWDSAWCLNSTKTARIQLIQTDGRCRLWPRLHGQTD